MYSGDELTVEGDSRFLSLLRLRHAPRHLRPSQYWTVRKTLDARNSLSLIYSDVEYEETLSLVHDLSTRAKGRPLRLRSEFLKELMDDPDGEGYGFRGRGEYLFDNVGYNRLGFTTEYRHGDYSFYLSLTLRTLFSQHQGRLVNVNKSRIRTSFGAVHGKVFVDYNGNHRADVNEPGVANVKVHLGQYLTAVTDREGYYILSSPSHASEVRVYLDPETVPATYSVTHGTQLANVHRDTLTEVSLCLAPLISLLGHVVAVEPTVETGGLLAISTPPADSGPVAPVATVPATVIVARMYRLRPTHDTESATFFASMPPESVVSAPDVTPEIAAKLEPDESDSSSVNVTVPADPVVVVPKE